ncbi:LysR family transcriptional regulator [Acuticoccus mangrovi]|uniref:LysR family transcriptional regulator n=1 Tax=Acuticoccus mangrovi TaxID=2796142 RepID=A0A934MFH7_9HYPH|nr:LysR family transcriptional regulator [Acuticoccus mangrovi]MBJ3775483.1 LysR family transcriptional regulator [Acuticoccus mangrovi]
MRHLQTLRYVDAVARAGSIRKAAETLAITSTALNRRILALEEDLGVPIFERLANGVRLSTAGEILIQHVREQLTDMERVKSRIADLSGLRRGHVSIACSQALLPHFLPEQIAHYRANQPAVTFQVMRRDRAAAEAALVAHDADIAIVFEPVRLSEFHTLLTVRQTVHAVVARNHPLAGEGPVRLRDCLRFPVAVPTQDYGVRHLLELALRRSSLEMNVALESDSFEFLRGFAHASPLVSFQIPIGLEENPTFNEVSRPLDERDMPSGLLYMGQLRGRALPIAPASFADQLARAFSERFECV